MAACGESNEMDTGSSDSDCDMKSTSTTQDVKPNLSGYHTQIMKDVFSGLKDEIDENALEALQIEFGRVVKNPELYTKLVSKRKWEDVLQVLLEYVDDDVPLVIKILYECVLSCGVMNDLPEPLKVKMEFLNDVYVRNKDVWGSRPLYGRDQQLQELKTHMDFDKHRDVKLVNICGMTGIGKSYLARCFVSRHLVGQSVPVYVDARETSLPSELWSMLVESLFAHKINGKPTQDDMMTSFYSFLKEHSKERYVIVFDDFSKLMSQSTQRESLEFLDGIVKEANLMKIQVKILVTSQTHFTMTTTEKNEMEGIKDIKLKMKDYTKDLPLQRLSNADAEKVFGSALNSNVEVKSELLKYCDGHPFLLTLMGAAAEIDYTPTAERTALSLEDVNNVTIIVEEHLSSAFDRLPMEGRLTLLAVTLFERDAQLNALHYILGCEKSQNQFNDMMKKQFFNQFWLTFRKYDIKEEKEKYTVVNTHHPLVLNFLKKKMNGYLEDTDSSCHNECVKFKRRYVIYFASEMVKIGAGCVGIQAHKDRQHTPNFLPSLCARFMRVKPHINQAFHYMTMDSQLLFSAEADVYKLRKPSDVTHIFVCLHQFYDCFDDRPLKAVRDLVHSNNIGDAKHRVLLWALYVMLLTVEGDWSKLYVVLKNRNEIMDPKHLSSVSPDLYIFSKAIYGYANGALHSFSSWAKECTDSALVERRIEAFRTAVKVLSLPHLSSDWSGVRRYFSIRILLSQAESTYLANPDNISAIRDSYALCKKAKGLVSDGGSADVNVEILTPLVLSKMATFRAIEGNVNVAERKMKYKEAHHFHDKVNKEFELRGMKKSVVAARNLVEHGTLMRSWAITYADEGLKRDALKYLRSAISFSQQAISILELSPRSNRLILFIACVDTADSMEISQCLTDKSASYQRVKFQSAAFRYYRKAYNLILRYYHGCHLSANETRLATLKHRLIVMLTKHGFPVEHIDKVRSNLERVQDLARRESDEKVHFSGSEFDNNSSDSDSDLFAPSTGESSPTLAQVTNDIEGTLTSLDIAQPAVESKLVDASQISIEMDSNEDKSPSAKRKRPA